jgi:hypothetical protein
MEEKEKKLGKKQDTRGQCRRGRRGGFDRARRRARGWGEACGRAEEGDESLASRVSW